LGLLRGEGDLSLRRGVGPGFSKTGKGEQNAPPPQKKKKTQRKGKGGKKTFRLEIGGRGAPPVRGQWEPEKEGEGRGKLPPGAKFSEKKGFVGREGEEVVLATALVLLEERKGEVPGGGVLRSGRKRGKPRGKKGRCSRRGKYEGGSLS